MGLELKGRVALVTGAARGIGNGIALVLAEKGADIIVNDIDINDEGKRLGQTISELGRKVLLVEADVSKEDEVRKMFALSLAEFGRIDFLINNAGTSQNKDIFDISLDDWYYILNTNLTSNFLCAREAMRIMKQQRFGRIINISSVVADKGSINGHLHYTATKSGILGLTKTLSRTGARFGINVNAIAPGVIESELLRKTHGEEGIRKICESIPLGLGKPRSVGLAAAFLCGEGGDYITGSTLDINGGMNMK